jgi:hypothetical protein
MTGNAIMTLNRMGVLLALGQLVEGETLANASKPSV